MGFFHLDRVSVYERVLGIAPVVCLLLVALGLVLEDGLWLLVVVLMLSPVIYLADYSQRLAREKIAAEQRHTRAIAELHLRTIEALAEAIDAKDNTTHEHLRRVVLYAEAIGKELQLPDDELDALRTAALLHDI